LADSQRPGATAFDGDAFQQSTGQVRAISRQAFGHIIGHVECNSHSLALWHYTRTFNPKLSGLRLARQIIRIFSSDGVFGNHNRIFGHPRMFMRGLSGAKVEIGLATMAYNLKRITNVLGATKLTEALHQA
jgi:hypothetical protein